MDISQIRRHKPCSAISKYHTALRSRNWQLDAVDVFTDCSAIGTAMATGALAALLLFKTITLPPPETSKRSHSSGRVSHCRTRIGRPRKKNFLDLDMC